MASETELRTALVNEALTWIGTPYHSTAGLKGVGSNCALFLYGAAKNAGAIAADAPKPGWYTPQLAVHSKEERLLAYAKAYGGREIPEAEAKPGDVVLFKIGSARGHAALIVEWPTMIHVLNLHGCQLGNVNEGIFAGKARTYLTFWHEPERN